MVEERGLVDIAEHLGHGGGLRLSAQDVCDRAPMFSILSPALETKYRNVHPRLSRASIYAPKGITPRVCGWSMVGNNREVIETVVSIGEDGPDEV